MNVDFFVAADWRQKHTQVSPKGVQRPLSFGRLGKPFVPQFPATGAPKRQKPIFIAEHGTR